MLLDVLRDSIEQHREKKEAFEASLRQCLNEAGADAEIVEDGQISNEDVAQQNDLEDGHGLGSSQQECKQDSEGGDDDEGIEDDLEMSDEEASEYDGDTKLEIDMKFDTKEEVFALMKRYEKMTKTSYTTRSSYKGPGQLIFECVHGIPRPSKSRGCRPVTKTKKVGCEARVCFYTRVPKGNQKEGVTTLTAHNLKHENHPVNDAIFKLDSAKVTPEASKIITDLSDLGCSVPTIQSALKRKKLPLTAGQVRHHLTKIKDLPKDEEDLKSFLKNVRATGGTVSIKRNQRGNIQAVQVSTAAMRKAYNGCRPETAQIDSTFNLESSKYIVNGVLFLDPATGKGELASISFMADETAESYRFVLSAFRDLSTHRPTAFLVDKDFTEFQVLQELFPQSRCLLCLFHVPKFLRPLINTATESPEKKTEIYELLDSLIHARDEDQFEEKLKLWDQAVKGVQIRTGSKYVDLDKYFGKNWLSCKVGIMMT